MFGKYMQTIFIDQIMWLIDLNKAEFVMFNHTNWMLNIPFHIRLHVHSVLAVELQ